MSSTKAIIETIEKRNEEIESNQIMLEATATHGCTQCSYQTFWKFQFDQHIQRHHGNVYAAEHLFRAVAEPELYPCICCPFESPFKLGRYEHYKHKHGDISSDKNNQTTYPCKHCSYIGHSSLSLLQHLDSCDTEPKYPVEYVILPSSSASSPAIFEPDGFQCLQCPYNGKTKSLLKKHMLVHAAAAEIKWSSCTKCSYKTKRKYHLKAHMLTHDAIDDDKITWFNCTKCSYRSKKKVNLDRHAVTHATSDDAIVWFDCTECSYRAKVKERLKRHMEIHVSTDYRFGCTQCSYRAKRKAYLLKHMATHAAADDVNWQSCSQCSYRSTKLGNLKRHMLTRHAAEDEIVWFDCPMCFYRGKEKQQLSRHMITHVPDENVKWFACDKCSFRAKRQEYVKRHDVQVHAVAGGSSDDWFNCEKCSFRTKRRANLKRHMLTQTHAVNNDITSVIFQLRY